MIQQQAMVRVLRPLSESLPPELQRRGRESLEALSGLAAKDQLELACRTVLGDLMATQPPFQGENELVFNDLCAAVLQWLRQEVQSLRFARRQ